MFGKLSKSAAETEAKFAALDRSQGIIEFDLNGTVLTANKNFLSFIGYTLIEIRDQQHILFVEPGYGDSAEYKNFWANTRPH